MTDRVDLDPGIIDVDGLPVPRITITYDRHGFELSAREHNMQKLVAPV